MRGLLHLGEGEKTHVVGLAHFLQRPPDGRIARQTHAAIGRGFRDPTAPADFWTAGPELARNAQRAFQLRRTV